MRYYCKGSNVVLGISADEQVVDPSKYGFGTYLVIVPGGVMPAPPPYDPTKPPPDPTAFLIPYPDITQPDTISASVKDECGRRIVAEVDAAQQRNINAYVSGLQQTVITGGTLTTAQTDDIATATAIFQWIGRPDGMQGTSDALIAAADQEWWLDGKWPPWNTAWDAFVARF